MIQRQRPRRRSSFLPQIIFLILTFITAVSGTYVALELFGGRAQQQNAPEVITIEIVITATPAPTAIQALIAGGAQTSQVNLPASLGQADAAGAAATVDANRIGAVDVIISTPTPEPSEYFLPDNCLYHTVVSGDTPFGIADRYNADHNLMLQANNLTIETAVSLQIGQRLLVPLPGCNVTGLLDDASAAESADAGSDSSAALPALEIELVDAEGIGDITAEGIRLRNNGGQLNITGWTLSDERGNIYVFPELLLYSDVQITLYTRSGRSTGFALFWGRDESVWRAGAQLSLSDRDGNLRKTFTIPGDITLD